jgi:hypothetical protein
MASTRNKNSRGDYVAEQIALDKERNYFVYQHSSSGCPIKTMYAGDGLLMGRMPPMQLSNNFIDIETDLLGVGSTNLVNPLPKIHPDIRSLDTLAIVHRPSVIMPNTLITEPFQRPLPS